MRRRLDYQAAADEPDAFAAVFGLRTWPATDADARTARPIWTAAVDPFVLIATARPCSRDEGNFDLARVRARSEEHTSELQSLMRISYAVFCLTNKKHKSLIRTTTPIYSITHNKVVLSTQQTIIVQRSN